jgi:type I restriction enzyme S subunit
VNAVRTDGWSSLPISEIANFGSGDSISVAQLSERSAAFPVPVFGGNGIAGYTSKATVSEPTVILGRVGQKCGAVYRNSGPAWITDNALYVRRYKRPVDVHFLAFALEAAHLNDVRNRNDLPLITQSILKDVKIAWPESIGEQRRIAEAMSDASKAISALELMITKKRAIRQGVMQQLLTGRTRLPGFTESWRDARLGDVLTVRHGKSQKAVESPGGRYPILATGGQIGWSNTPLYGKPSVLIGRKGTIDRPQYQATPFWTVDTLFYTEIGTQADPRYLYYIFLMVDWRSMNEASGVPSLNSRSVESVEVQLPGLDEQRAIRSVLDDADCEIDKLTSRLDKARSVKQGMMQQLLTGRTRLPVPEATL